MTSARLVRPLAVLALAAGFAGPALPVPARAQSIEYYHVHCANGRIEVELADEAQMKVRRGSDVCQLRRFTSHSSALDWAQKNFGGRGAKCSC